MFVACTTMLGVCGAARAQILPSSPIVLGNGVVTLGGDISTTLGSADPGFYDYTDYEYSSLRRIRAALLGSLKLGNRVSLLSEVRVEHTVLNQGSAGDSARMETSALYVRIRPWTSRNIDIQVGRIPPTFGAFARRTYAHDNPLIGYPLGNQYLVSLRPDAVPATADDLLKMRGRGWLSSFPILATGAPTSREGVPLAASLRWDTGVQVHAAGATLDATGSVTTGSLANPLVTDDNDGQQYAGRIAWHPVVGFIVGGSVSHAPFLSTRAAQAALGSGAGTHTQEAYGADAEYSRNHYVLRAEAIVSRWRLPLVKAPYIDRPLDAAAVSVEGQYRILPGLYAAARVDHLGFSRITGSAGTESWEAPVTRVEVGGGISIQRNLLLKAAVQYNRRDGTRIPRSRLGAVEVLWWF
jgi:hypothetical protein